MRNFVKSALFSALLLSALVSPDIKAGPIFGGLGAGIVLGAGVVWQWFNGPVNPSSPLTLLTPDPSAPTSVKIMLNTAKTTECVKGVAPIAAVVGWICAILPTP